MRLLTKLLIHNEVTLVLFKVDSLASISLAIWSVIRSHLLITDYFYFFFFNISIISFSTPFANFVYCSY
jgi:hypothetical protein